MLFLPAIMLCLRLFVKWTVRGDSLGKYIRVGCHVLFQGIFPTQASNPRLWHQVETLLSEPPGKSDNTGVASLSLLQGIVLTQVSNWDLLHCRCILFLTTELPGKHLHLYPRAKYHRRSCLSPATHSHPSPGPKEESVRAQRSDILVSWLEFVVSCFADVPSLSLSLSLSLFFA